MQPIAMTVQTIADIARLANVSKSTVSRALNDSPLISGETKDLIRALAEEHGFEMSVSARRLRRKQSFTIGFVTYPYRTDQGPVDAFMLELMTGVASGLHEHAYDLLMLHVDRGDSDWVHQNLRSGRVDGFVLLSATCSPQHLSALLAAGAPFAIWDVAPRTHRGYCAVSGDSENGGRLATEHLIARGRRRIGFLGGPAGAPEVQDRLAGYAAVLGEAGLAHDPKLVAYGSWEAPDAAGAAAAAELLERSPDLDAIFANSDLLALGAIDALRRHGRRVPDDVAVVGYDDVLVARFASPPLTTIRQNAPLAGRLLARTLVQRIEEGVVTNVSVPAELVVRESS